MWFLNSYQFVTLFRKWPDLGLPSHRQTVYFCSQDSAQVVHSLVSSATHTGSSLWPEGFLLSSAKPDNGEENTVVTSGNKNPLLGLSCGDASVPAQPTPCRITEWLWIINWGAVCWKDSHFCVSGSGLEHASSQVRNTSVDDWSLLRFTLLAQEG
jgi:hypothetical protein